MQLCPNKRYNSLIFCNNYMHNVSEWKSCTILKLLFVDLLLVRYLFLG